MKPTFSLDRDQPTKNGGSSVSAVRSGYENGRTGPNGND